MKWGNKALWLKPCQNCKININQVQDVFGYWFIGVSFCVHMNMSSNTTEQGKGNYVSNWNEYKASYNYVIEVNKEEV